LAKKGQNPHPGPEIPEFRGSRAGVLHQPLAEAPGARGAGSGDLWGPPGPGPPLGEGPPGQLPGSRIPGSGSRRPRRPLSGLPEAPAPRGRARRGLFYINPSRGPKRAKKPLLGAEPGKMALFGHFWRKSPFLAILEVFSPVATGLFFPILAKKGQNPHPGPEIPGFRGSRAGVLHQPLAEAPGARGPGSETSGDPQGPGPPLGGPPGQLPGSQIPGSGSRGPRGPLSGLPEAPAPRGRARRGLFYINPSRRGPAVPGVRGPGRQSRPGAPPTRAPAVGGYKDV